MSSFITALCTVAKGRTQVTRPSSRTHSAVWSVFTSPRHSATEEGAVLSTGCPEWRRGAREAPRAQWSRGTRWPWRLREGSSKCQESGRVAEPLGRSPSSHPTGSSILDPFPAPSLPSSSCPPREPRHALLFSCGQGLLPVRGHRRLCYHSRPLLAELARGCRSPRVSTAWPHCWRGGGPLPSTGVPTAVPAPPLPTGVPRPPRLHGQHTPRPRPPTPGAEPGADVSPHGVTRVTSLACPQRPEGDLQNVTGK